MLSREELIEALSEEYWDTTAPRIVAKLEALGIFPLKLSEEEIEARADAVAAAIASGCSFNEIEHVRIGAKRALRDLSKPIPPVKSWEAVAHAISKVVGVPVKAPLAEKIIEAARPLMPEGD